MKAALSSRNMYKLYRTSCQLHCIAAPLLWHFVLLDVQQKCCSGELSALSDAGKKNWKICSKERYVYFNWWNISVGSVTWIDCKVRKCSFDGIWNPLERKLFVHPPPLEKFTLYLFQTPLPLGISIDDPPCWGYGYFLEPHSVEETLRAHCICFVYFSRILGELGWVMVCILERHSLIYLWSIPI